MAAATGPLTLGEILDRTVQLYRRNFLLLASIASPPAAASVLVYGTFSIYFNHHTVATAVTPKGTPNPFPFGQPDSHAWLAMALLFTIGIPLTLLVFAVGFNAASYAVLRLTRGESVTLRESYQFSLRKFGRGLGILSLQFLFAAILPFVGFFGVVIGGSVLTGIVAATGAGKTIVFLFIFALFVWMVALLVVSVWVWIRFSLAYPVSVTEDQKPWPSLKRSGQLSKGSRGRIFVTYLLLYALSAVAIYALTIPVDILIKLVAFKSMAAVAFLTKPPMVVSLVNFFISFLERSFVVPIYSVALMLFYIDQRVRQEGYDIELLMAQAGWSKIPPPIPAFAPPFPTPSYPSQPAYVAPSPFDPSAAPASPPAPPPHIEPEPQSGPAGPEGSAA